MAGSGILVIDFVMRILLIEKKVAARYESTVGLGAANPRDHSTDNRNAETTDEEAGEEDALLPRDEKEESKIPESQNRLIRNLPILYCLSDPRLLTALLVAFVQATL